MPKRHKIVEEKLVKYNVSEKIPERLKKLSFKETPSHLSDWQLFTRKAETTDSRDDFAAIYGDNEFLVEGRYSSIETPERDLETISKVFNEGRVSRLVRERGIAFEIGVPLGVLTLMGGYLLNDVLSDSWKVFNYLESIGVSSDEGIFMSLLGIMIGVPASVCMGINVVGGLLNRHYGSRLSKQAENYNYGERAESKLATEYVFDSIKSGQLSVRDFLESGFLVFKKPSE